MIRSACDCNKDKLLGLQALSCINKKFLNYV